MGLGWRSSCRSVPLAILCQPSPSGNPVPAHTMLAGVLGQRQFASKRIGRTGGLGY